MSNRTAWPGQATTGATHTAAHDNDLPGGWIGYVQVTASQSGISGITDLTGLSQAVTVNTSRRIKITAEGRFTSDTAGNLVGFFIREGATTLNGAQIELATSGGPGASDMTATVILTPSTGSHTYKLSLSLVDGSGTVSLSANTDNPAFLLVEDIGPA